MWLFTKTGFVSVVRHRDNDDLMLRARVREDLTDLLATFGVEAVYTVQEDTMADYRFRVTIPEAVFAGIVGAAIADIDYTTSVKSALDKGDSKRHSAMMSVWSAMMRLQKGGIYSGGHYSDAGYRRPTLWGDDDDDGLAALFAELDEAEDDDGCGGSMERWDSSLEMFRSCRGCPDCDIEDEDEDEDEGEADVRITPDFVSVSESDFSKDFEVSVWNAYGSPSTITTVSSREEADRIANRIREAALSWGVDNDLLGR